MQRSNVKLTPRVKLTTRVHRRHHRLRSLLLAATTFTVGAAVDAAEFRSVQTSATVLYDAPSVQAAKRFVIGRYYPLEVLVKLDRWTKVRDEGGDIGWIEARDLTDKRVLVITEAGAAVRARPAADAPVVFRADKGLLLEMSEAPANGWIRVRHRDGETGYVGVRQVWGL